ncbi:MAG TPA: FUSC family protein [Candidatus Dormibacteraeota bacterium]|nr:FUSC family protein [Candidatus Dormibacteraeota bacterium]
MIRDPQVTLFVAFGTFALVTMGDFGGPSSSRAAAYAVTTVLGAGLIALGTLASSLPWTAALAMLVVACCLQFAGVFGGYAAAAQGALLLAFVLAVTVPGTPATVGPRLAGWAISGAIATFAGLLLWPRYERVLLRRRAAAACRALACLVAAGRQPLDNGALTGCRRSAEAAVQDVRREYRATAQRPAGPTHRDRAFAQLLTELARGLLFAEGASDRRPGAHPCLQEGNLLAAAVVRSLGASAAVLEGGRPPEYGELREACLAHRQALDRWAAARLRRGAPAAEVLAGLDHDQRLRVLSYLALALGVSATTAAGQRVETRRLPLPADVRAEAGVAGRVLATVRTHLTPSSSALHNTLRAALGLAAAVLAARLLGLGHGFWVVLGTLSVIRSSAMATGRTTLQVLAGTAIGIAVGVCFLIATSGRPAALWIALPLAVFLAAYTPTAVHFVAGQAAFTVFVIVLFNLLSPLGWQVGLVRLEDLAIGTGIGLAVALLLWPRGIRAELQRGLADVCASVAALLGTSFARLAGASVGDPAAARRLAADARERAGESFDRLLNERASTRVPAETGAALLAGASHAIIVTDFLNLLADREHLALGCAEGARAVSLQSEIMVGAWRDLAGRLAGHQADVAPAVSGAALHEAAERCLRAWGGLDPDRADAALGTATAAEWIWQLGQLATDLRAPAGAVADAAAIPWWR